MEKNKEGDEECHVLGGKRGEERGGRSPLLSHEERERERAKGRWNAKKITFRVRDVSGFSVQMVNGATLHSCTGEEIILISMAHARLGRTVKQEQVEISRNHTHSVNHW